MTRQFHIEDRERGQIVATGGIDAANHVTFDETEPSVSDEIAALAQQIEGDLAEGYSGGQLRLRLEWFEL